MRVTTWTLLSCVCLAAAPLTAAGDAGSDHDARLAAQPSRTEETPQRPTAVHVPCLCQSDLQRALEAQKEIPPEFVGQTGTRRQTVFSRLYRDGYRPVRTDGHEFWCRNEAMTASRIPDVRCEFAWSIENEYATSSRLL